MIRKYLCLLLTLAVGLTFSSCGKKSENADVDSAEAENQSGIYEKAFLGEWLMDGGEGHYNLKYFDKDRKCTYISPYGEVTVYDVKATADKITFKSGNLTEENEVIDGEIVDMAGFRYKLNATPSDVNQTYVGTWAMNGGAGTNTLRIYKNGAYNLTAADGSVTHGRLTVNYGIVLTQYTEQDGEMTAGTEMRYTSTPNGLEDPAGYTFVKKSNSPY